MTNENMTFDRMSKCLRSQEYDLRLLNDHEILIRGVPTITSFMFFVLILIGVVLFAVGIFSVTLGDPEWISGSLFMLAGLFLILLPFQNYYSKKGYTIYINRNKKEVMIRTFGILPSTQAITFDNIASITLKKVKTNTFVDDTSKSSQVQHYTFDLNLRKGEDETLISFYKKDDESEEFANDFMKYLADLLDKETKEVVEA